MNGMKWADILCTLKGMLHSYGYPSAILLHCGGNDIGHVPLGKLMYEIRSTFAYIFIKLLPGVPIIWSAILPRLKWRSPNYTKMERTRAKVNRYVRSYLLKHNCYIVKHPDFSDKHNGLFHDDGVHLSFIGRDLFINSIQGALETFFKYPGCHVYPTA